MDILTYSALVLCIALTYFMTSQAQLELHYGVQELDEVEGEDLTIVCEADFRDTDSIREKIQWLRGNPVEKMDIVAQRDRRISINTDITSNTGAEVRVRSNLTISGLVLGDSSNYTCCKRDSYNCISWDTRKHRQLQVEIHPKPHVKVSQVSDLDSASTKSSPPISTVETLLASTVSTTVSDEIYIPTNMTKPDNEALRQNSRAVYTIGLPCAIAFILMIVVIAIARYHWRRKHFMHVETPVESFEEAV
ncbi:uncharacterized protein LOC121406220 [Lytechinus variegatus]|uniref:uncharacterized protein LOC121406220 n=1 Tax=Lytechinus variegatus TaxID=7654 RepID=UPI001BB1F108|nr:uncharacterized protein LOC121406220 [Lytechinus variegatus]